MLDDNAFGGPVIEMDQMKCRHNQARRAERTPPETQRLGPFDTARPGISFQYTAK